MILCKQLCQYSAVKAAMHYNNAEKNLTCKLNQKLTKKLSIMTCNPLAFCGANKTGTSKVGAISKAQKAQSFLNMPRMYS